MMKALPRRCAFCCSAVGRAAGRAARARRRRRRPTRRRSTCRRRRRATSSRPRRKRRSRCRCVTEPARNAPPRVRPAPREPAAAGRAGQAGRAAEDRSRRSRPPKPVEEPPRPPSTLQTTPATAEGEVERGDSRVAVARERRSQPHRLPRAERRRANAVRHREAVHPAGRGRDAGEESGVCEEPRRQGGGARRSAAAESSPLPTRTAIRLLTTTVLHASHSFVFHSNSIDRASWHFACSIDGQLRSSRTLREDRQPSQQSACASGGAESGLPPAFRPTHQCTRHGRS